MAEENSNSKPTAEETPKPQKTEQGGRSIADFFKKKKGDKKFFLKVGIGIGVVLLLLIIIIVVAAVVPRGGDGGEDTPVDGTATQSPQSPQSTDDPNPQTPPPPIPIASYHMIRLSSVTSFLAIDDVTETYVIQADEEFRSIYYIVKFKERSQIYVGIQKKPNADRSQILENTVLFCESRGLESSFTGQFLNADSMAASGRTHYTTISGSNITITSSSISNPLTLTGPMARLFRSSSCDALTPQDMFQWDEKETACEGNQTAVSDYGSCPGNRRCPNFDSERPLSPTKVCKTFRMCNYVMGDCDRFWTSRNPYNDRPYCNCRQKLAAEAADLMCPDPSNDQGDCEVPRRRAEDLSTKSPCLCHYTIRRIFPYTRRGNGGITWRADSITVTGSSPSIEQCRCGS